MITAIAILVGTLCLPVPASPASSIDEPKAKSDPALVSTVTDVAEEDAAKLADKYVKDHELDWGTHAKVRKASSGFSVEYETPDREKRDIGVREITVSTDGKTVSKRTGRK